jgi:hypothetical protein
MTDKKEPLKLVFAPGCFDSFDGTQEELDALIAEIEEAFASGEALENAVPIDIDELLEDDPEFTEALFTSIDATRRLQ